MDCTGSTVSDKMLGMSDDRGIPITTRSHLEGDRGELSDWLLVQSQGAGLTAPPMSVLGHTVVSSRSEGELYISSVFLWWSSLGTPLVTGSLLFTAPVRGGIVLRLLRVLADFLPWTVDGISRTTSGDRLVLNMATGSGQPKASRPGGDLPVWVHVPWSSRGAGVTLGSGGLYDLDTRYIPDVLGLRARRPEAAVVEVMSRKDNQCVWVLIPDGNVGHVHSVEK